MGVKVSIIIPCYNESKYIAQSVRSVINQDYPVENIEVFYIDGGSTDGTIETIQKLTRRFPHIKLLHNKHKTVPYALNQGIRAAKGSYILRMDVHSDFPVDYVSKLIDWHGYLDADNLGGVCYTDVQLKSKSSEAIKLVMSDRFGVGNSTFRVGARTLLEVDTVPFGCYRREVFDKIGLFDERLTRNQDIEFNKRLKRLGGTIYLVPNVYCTYFARDTFKALFKNRFRTGYWIVKTSFLTKSFKNLSVRHFVPLLFVATLLGPILFGLVWPGFFIVALTTFLLYLLVMTKRSIKISNGNTPWIYVLFGFFVLHFSYGLGSLFGIQNIKFLIK
jgi:glycosyltransferase involved in cell wall biosynthesis